MFEFDDDASSWKNVFAERDSAAAAGRKIVAGTVATPIAKAATAVKNGLVAHYQASSDSPLQQSAPDVTTATASTVEEQDAALAPPPIVVKKTFSKHDYCHILSTLLSTYTTDNKQEVSEDALAAVDHGWIQNRNYLAQKIGQEEESFLHFSVRSHTNHSLFNRLLSQYETQGLFTPDTAQSQDPAKKPLQNRRGEGPWAYAYRTEQYDHAAMLFPYCGAEEAATSFSRVDTEQENGLHRVARVNNAVLVDMLESALSPKQLQQFVWQRNRYGGSPLHIACAFTNPRFFQRILAWVPEDQWQALCAPPNPLLSLVAQRGTPDMLSALLKAMDEVALPAMHEAREQHQLLQCAGKNTVHTDAMLIIIADFFTKYQTEMIHRDAILQAEVAAAARRRNAHMPN